MRSTSALLASVAGIAFLGSPVASQPPEHHHHVRSAKALLRRSMTHGRKIMVSAIVVQRPAHESDHPIELRVEQDGQGRVKFTTISPERFAGLISLDDGVEWTTYFPEDRKIVKQTSPRADAGNPVYQLALAVQNYSLSTEPSGSIADCPVICVTATPNSRELNKRRYYLEARTSFMLRLETVSPDGTKTVLLDTKSISFLKTPPDMDLGADMRRVSVERRRPPQRVSPPAEARPLVGFDPRTPDSLPLGFIVKETQVVGGGRDRFIAVRITDGFVNATVYEWDSDKRWEREPRFIRSGYREAGGVKMSLIGDMPRHAHDVLLAAFAK